MATNPAWEARIEAARIAKPLKVLLTEFGDAPANGNWKAFPHCPFCQKAACAGVFAKGGRDWFKCHHDDCPTGKKGLEEIGYLAQKQGVSRRDASVAFLKLAGQWSEERLAPSVMPGQRARRSRLAPPPPDEPPAAVQASAPEAEPEIPEESAAEAAAREAGMLAHARALSGNLPEIPEGSDTTLPPNETPESVQPPAGADAGPENIGTGAAAPVGDAPADAPADVAPAPLRALRAFYAQLTLSAADTEHLWTGRGLAPWMARLAGLVSNPRANEAILQGLATGAYGERFDPAALVEAGLWTREGGATEPHPSARYYGFHTWEEKDATTGEKVARKGWTYPILIPYWDREGRLIALRPHRGMLKGMVIRLYEANNCLARPEAAGIIEAALGELPAPGRAWAQAWLTGVAGGGEALGRCELGVLAEAEFKALAVAQAVWFGEGRPVAVASLPGIWMLKNLWGDITDWLDAQATPTATVVVGFDSEDKETPGLPGYKERIEDRYDAEKCALFGAWKLRKENYDGRVATLPVAWRDAKGKADWDGVLAGMLSGRIEVGEVARPAGGWKEQGLGIGRAFRRVLAAAARVPFQRQAELFGTVGERIIQEGFDKLRREPYLPMGGNLEERVAQRLRRFVGRSKDRVEASVRGHLLALADAYEGLGGGYYMLQEPSEKAALRWKKLLADAKDAGDVELRRMVEVVMKGLPHRISDFRMKPHYKVIRASGKSGRMVSLFSIHGERVEFVELPAEWFAQPVKFRQWLLECGGFSWGMGRRAGEIQLQQLHADVNHDLADKTVQEVDYRGYHEESRLWFFKDSVWPGDGDPWRPDKSGIVWVRGGVNGAAWTQGYLLGEPEKREQEFKQDAPALQPPYLDKQGRAQGVASSVAEDVALFGEVCRRMYETVGGFEAYVAIGMVLANLGSVEVRRAHSCFPGLWVHGEQGHGKSSLVRWLMALLGFDCENGVKLTTSSVPGLTCLLQSMSSLPVWLEEYQPDCPKWIIDLLKSTYGHEVGAKMTERRLMRASAIVSGVATCRDAQTKSRFAHVQVAAQQRLVVDGEPVDHFAWFQANQDRFFVIGRRLLRHRRRYVELLMQILNTWVESREMREVEARARMVHGVAYAGFMAAVTLLNELAAAGEETEEFGQIGAQLPAYRSFLVRHCGLTATEVRGNVYANQFWSDVVAALKQGVFGETPVEVGRYFSWDQAECAALPDRELPADAALLPDGRVPLGPPGAEGQAWRPRPGFGTRMAHPWQDATLYFNADTVLAAMRRWKVGQREEFPLDRDDLRAQLGVKPYWLPGELMRRFYLHSGGPMKKSRCWGIRVTAHEMGYAPVADAEWQASFYANGDPASGQLVPMEEWDDPRKGELWLIAAALERGRADKE
jgi:hypothetical protein